MIRLAAPAPVLGTLDAALSGLPGLLGDIPICHADAQPASVPSEPNGQPNAPLHDCALCPICQLAAAPAVLPADVWLPVPLWSGASPLGVRPASTGPPLPARYAAAPRGPPISAI